MNLFTYSASKKLAIITLLFMISWTAFMLFIMPYADQVTGECSGTPGHNYGHAIFIIPTYFAIFGYWIFRVLQGRKVIKRLLITVFYLLILPLFIAFVVTLILLHSAAVETVSKLDLYEILYTHGCYYELEIRNAFLLPVVAAFSGLTLYFVLISENRNKAVP